MRTYRVLVRRTGLAGPSVHLVQTEDEAVARVIADVLLRDTPDADGVEVWDDERRLYARDRDAR